MGQPVCSREQGALEQDCCCAQMQRLLGVVWPNPALKHTTFRHSDRLQQLAAVPDNGSHTGHKSSQNIAVVSIFQIPVRLLTDQRLRLINGLLNRPKL
jgi:hypothetical protein